MSGCVFMRRRVEAVAGAGVRFERNADPYGMTKKGNKRREIGDDDC